MTIGELEFGPKQDFEYSFPILNDVNTHLRFPGVAVEYLEFFESLESIVQNYLFNHCNKE